MHRASTWPVAPKDAMIILVPNLPPQDVPGQPAKRLLPRVILSEFGALPSKSVLSLKLNFSQGMRLRTVARSLLCPDLIAAPTLRPQSLDLRLFSSSPRVSTA